MRAVFLAIIIWFLAAVAVLAQHVPIPGVSDGPISNPIAAGCLPTGSGVIRGTGSGGCAPAQPNTDFVPPAGPATATSGLVNDTANHQTLSAAGPQQGSPDVPEISTDGFGFVHLGGLGASGILLDNASTVNQGSFISSSYGDQSLPNNNFTGGTDTCTNTVHTYTLAANSVIALNCPTNTGFRMLYRIYQPATGSVFTYSFVAQGGAQTIGDTPPTSPTPCAVNGCLDEISVEWVPGKNQYIINVFKQSILGGGGGGGQTCPTGARCRYVDWVGGSDANNGLTPGTAWKSIDKANNDLLNMTTAIAGGQDSYLLFKSAVTWPGDAASNVNHPVYLGDTAHSANYQAQGVSAQHPLYITTFGGTAPAVFDMKNNQATCFETVNPSTGNAVGNTVKYVNISNFTCTHAYFSGVYFDVNGTWFQGTGTSTDNMMVVNNVSVINVGYRCADNNSASCDSWITSGQGSPNVDPTLGTNGAKITGNTYQHDATHTGIVLNGSDWWLAPATPCTAGAGTAWPANPTDHVTVYNDGGCVWKAAGASALNYMNEVEWFDSLHSAKASVKFTNLTIQNGAGHNLLEVDGDNGSPIVAFNTLGPGSAPHGMIDLKMVGNFNVANNAAQAQVLGNTVSCGLSLGLCSCQQIAANTGVPCGPNNAQTLSIYMQQSHSLAGAITGQPSATNILIEGNVVYDSYIGIQTIVSASGDDCPTNATACPAHIFVYHNTIHLGQGGSPVAGTFCMYASGGNGNKTGTTLDYRDNICDGANTLFSVPTGNYAAIPIENHNDLGGSTGYTNSYSFNGSSAIPASDLHCASSCSGGATDPKYDCEIAGGTACDIGSGAGQVVPPSYTLQTGSPTANAAGKGVGGLGMSPWSGSSGIGAFN